MSESEKIKQLIEEQVKQLLQKRAEVQAKVQGELDDIDRALRQLGHLPPTTQKGAVAKQKRGEKVADEQIVSALRAFMKPGESRSASEILSKLNIKAARFSAFKSSHKDFFITQGAKRSMRYSLRG